MSGEAARWIGACAALGTTLSAGLPWRRTGTASTLPGMELGGLMLRSDSGLTARTTGGLLMAMAPAGLIALLALTLPLPDRRWGGGAAFGAAGVAGLGSIAACALPGGLSFVAPGHGVAVAAAATLALVGARLVGGAR